LGRRSSAVDIEYTGPAEQSLDIPVRSVADGEVIFAGEISGCGGQIVIRHSDPESVTSQYCHVRLNGAVKTGTNVTAGQVIAYLGAAFSAETSGARKHLHFGIHKGPALTNAGYEQTPAAQPTPPPAEPPHRGWLSRVWHFLTGWLD
jgi:murein DD-endopeptidase MepM/ murein hydrolase activator NlpD